MPDSKKPTKPKAEKWYRKSLTPHTFATRLPPEWPLRIRSRNSSATPDLQTQIWLPTRRRRSAKSRCRRPPSDDYTPSSGWNNSGNKSELQLRDNRDELKPPWRAEIALTQPDPPEANGVRFKSCLPTFGSYRGAGPELSRRARPAKGLPAGAHRSLTMSRCCPLACASRRTFESGSPAARVKRARGARRRLPPGHVLGREEPCPGRRSRRRWRSPSQLVQPSLCGRERALGVARREQLLAAPVRRARRS